MKTKVLIVVFIILTIIYGVVGGLLFLDIQMLKIPDTAVTLKVIGVSADEAVVQTIVEVTNPNSFELSIHDFEFHVTADAGSHVGHGSFHGENVPANEKRTFSADIPIAFQELPVETLQASVTGTIGLNVFGVIQKTLPLNITILTSLSEITERLQAPVLHFSVDLSDISDTGINIKGTADMYNPNEFDVLITNVSADIMTPSGTVVGTVDIPGGVLPGKVSQQFSGEGWLQLAALNEEKVEMKAQAHIAVRLAGYEKALDVTADAQITMPDLSRLLNKDKPLDLVIYGDYKIKSGQTQVHIRLDIINPHNITLNAKDITVTIYDVKNDEKTLVGTVNASDGVVPPKSNIRLECDMIIPKTRLITFIREMLSADWILTVVQGNLTIHDINQNIWFGISGYNDVHPFQ